MEENKIYELYQMKTDDKNTIEKIEKLKKKLGDSHMSNMKIITYIVKDYFEKEENLYFKINEIYIQGLLLTNYLAKDFNKENSVNYEQLQRNVIDVLNTPYVIDVAREYEKSK